MGIGISFIGTLMTLKEQGYLPQNSRIIEIGAQQLGPTIAQGQLEFSKLKQIFGIESDFRLKSYETADGRPWDQGRDGQLARELWEWLGFDYNSIDVDGSEKAIPLDLNYDEAPPEYIGKYNLVTNFGTSEHVINQLNVFKMIHELTAFGGLMVHVLPSQGMLLHGLFGYTPKFFWKLCKSNGYHVVAAGYKAGKKDLPIPPNLLEHFAPYQPNIHAQLADYRGTEYGVNYVLQKMYDIPFVPPIDIPTGTKTDNEVLKKRYWSVFNDDAFDHHPRYVNGG